MPPIDALVKQWQLAIAPTQMASGYGNPSHVNSGTGSLAVKGALTGLSALSMADDIGPLNVENSLASGGAGVAAGGSNSNPMWLIEHLQQWPQFDTHDDTSTPEGPVTVTVEQTNAIEPLFKETVKLSPKRTSQSGPQFAWGVEAKCSWLIALGLAFIRVRLRR